MGSTSNSSFPQPVKDPFSLCSVASLPIGKMKHGLVLWLTLKCQLFRKGENIFNYMCWIIKSITFSELSSYPILSLGKAAKSSGPTKELVCVQNHDA